jgi:hypothetical protein
MCNSIYLAKGAVRVFSPQEYIDHVVFQLNQLRQLDLGLADHRMFQLKQSVLLLIQVLLASERLHRHPVACKLDHVQQTTLAKFGLV